MLEHKVGSGDVDREDRVPLIAGGFAQAGPDGAGYAGAPDDDVDSPESNAGPRKRRDHLGLVGHIHQDRVATGQLGGDLGESGVVSIEQGHLGPLARQGVRHRSADAAGGAGDDGAPGLEAEVHRLLPSCGLDSWGETLIMPKELRVRASSCAR